MFDCGACEAVPAVAAAPGDFVVLVSVDPTRYTIGGAFPTAGLATAWAADAVRLPWVVVRMAENRSIPRPL